MIAVLVAMVAASPTMGWSGRSLSLLDPSVQCLTFLLFKLSKETIYAILVTLFT
jgi:hypothetical protein